MSDHPLQESETVEPKKALTQLKQGLVSMAAILNKHQVGTLWVGVRNYGAIVGIDANEKTLRDLSQSIAAHIKPRIFPRISEVILAALKKQPSISIRRLSVQCDMSVHSVQHHINKLKEIGFIRHVGPTKAGRWEVVGDHIGASDDGGVGGGDA